MRFLTDPRWNGVGAIAGIAAVAVALIALRQGSRLPSAAPADPPALTKLTRAPATQPVSRSASPARRSAGAALLPAQRIVCYYGHPSSTRMGALGEYPRDEMLQRLRAEVSQWTAADPLHPALPCLHVIAAVAQGDPGASGHFRALTREAQLDSVYQMARAVGGILFIEIQTGTEDIRSLLPRFEPFLRRPDVHLAVEPEFMMKSGDRPGSRIGSIDAADINYVSGELARVVNENGLPPKVLVIHRFTRNMLTNHKDVVQRPEVQIVINMSGWGEHWLKIDTYRRFVAGEPVQFTGFKLFYHNDTRKGDPLMTPRDVLGLDPRPMFVVYQ